MKASHINPGQRKQVAQKLKALGIEVPAEASIAQLSELVAGYYDTEAPESLAERAAMLVNFVQPVTLGAVQVREFRPLTPQSRYFQDRGMVEALKRTAAVKARRIHAEFMDVAA